MCGLTRTSIAITKFGERKKTLNYIVYVGESNIREVKKEIK